MLLDTIADCHSLTAKPTGALIPYRSIAAISSSPHKLASAVVTPHNAPSNPSTPPMSVTGKERREVPLPSQEGKKGVMQYALYVSNTTIDLNSIPSTLRDRLRGERLLKIHKLIFDF